MSVRLTQHVDVRARWLARQLKTRQTPWLYTRGVAHFAGKTPISGYNLENWGPGGTYGSCWFSFSRSRGLLPFSCAGGRSAAGGIASATPAARLDGATTVEWPVHRHRWRLGRR